MLDKIVYAYLKSSIKPAKFSSLDPATLVKYQAVVAQAQAAGLDPATVQKLIEVLGAIAIIFLRLYLGGAGN